MSNPKPTGVTVFTRDDEHRNYPTGVSWAGERSAGPHTSADLDVFDAEGKVIATFRGQHWTRVELAR